MFVDIQLDVLVLWHQLIDHHNNSDRIPFHMYAKHKHNVKVTHSFPIFFFFFYSVADGSLWNQKACYWERYQHHS